MQQTVPFDLKDRITAALTNSRSELWFPHLTCDLMQNGLQKLYDETGVIEADYGTARVLLKDASAEQFIEGAIFTRKYKGEIKNETFVELLPANVIDQYKKSGVDFYTRKELRINTEITHCLRDAFEVIRHVPSLFTTVRSLVKTIHLIKPDDEEYDVSFSEPNIPFSIFVSVPSKNNPINTLRVAEGVVHEAMHLQLTLIEMVLNLISSNVNFYYSPWRDEYRTPRGVLHALYVFRVIQHFFISYSVNQVISKPVLNHIQSRYLEIDKQITSIGSFKECTDLTEAGAIFAERLFLEEL